jgi:hypothetical protein
VLRWFLDPKASDDDSLYHERALSIAVRFVQALEAKRYSEIWHELAADQTKEIFAAYAYLRARDSLAEAFRKPTSEITQEFLSYALANDIEGVRTGLWHGVRRTANKQSWLRADIQQPQVAFLNDGALVLFPAERQPMVVPLLSAPGGEYKVDLETFVVSSHTLSVNHFLTVARQATDTGDFHRAIRLLKDASRLGRAHDLLRQYAWQQVFTEERNAELAIDAERLSIVESLLIENRELAALDVAEAIRHDEDETLDFKELIPPAGNNDARKELARVFAGFATSGGGKIYFGINKLKQVIGIDEAKTDSGRDEFRKRLDNMCRDNIRPAISTRVLFLPYKLDTGTVIIPVAVIQPGQEPVYYADGRPYIRKGQSARPAEPHEIIELMRLYFIKAGWKAPG